MPRGTAPSFPPENTNMLAALSAGAASALYDAAREGRTQDLAAQRAVSALANLLRSQGASPETVLLRVKALIPPGPVTDRSPLRRLQENAVRWSLQAYFDATQSATDQTSLAAAVNSPGNESAEWPACRSSAPKRLCDDFEVPITLDRETTSSAEPETHPGGPSTTLRLERFDGEQWRVREIDVSRCAGQPQPFVLLFESATAVRRVRQYPANWCDLTATELSALSWHV